MQKSRFGVIHNCMLLITSKVAMSFMNPQAKDNKQSNGMVWWTSEQSKSTWVSSMHTSMPLMEKSSSWRLVNRNFIRNRKGNGMATPTSPQMKMNMMSSCMSCVAPIICCMEPR